MTTTKLNAFRTAFFYTLNTTKLDSSGVDSLMIELNGLKWTVQFRKNSNENCANAHALAICLVGYLKKNEIEWTCEAQASVKLLHKDGSDERAILKELPKKIFESSDSSHGIDDFIKWDEFLKYYVQNNQAMFEIEISTSPLKRKRATTADVNQFSTEFHVVIDNVSKLDSVCSSDVVLHDVRWRILIKKEDEFLAIYLNGMANDMDPNWSFKVYTTFQLLPFNSKVDAHTIRFNNTYNSSISGWGQKNFLKWSDFVDPNKNYVWKDQANLLVELKVTNLEPLWKNQCHTLKAANTSLDCCVCLDRFTSGQIFSIKCGHLFCEPCFNKSMTQRKVCPMCNVTTNVSQLHPIYFS